MTEPKPEYITIEGQDKPIAFFPSEQEGAVAECLIRLAEAMGYKDQGYQWAGDAPGHVHLLENAEGRVIRVTPMATVEVWRE